jgi:osmoprotectant transport system ATP-binding protein
MTSITFEEVSKHFPKTQLPAVHSVSFRVESGELAVIVGPSGCGKTTLLKTVNRLYEPTGGRVLLNDQDIRSQSVTGLRRRIGYVIQQVGLFPHMTVEKNIAVVPNLLGWEQQRIQERIHELFEIIGLPKSYLKRFPRQLSGGEQSRVGLARALAADPEILLMDEPFAAIDAITRVRLQDELISIQRRLHKTILFVTHDVEEALRLADHIAVMQEGRLVQYAPPQDILARPHDEFVSNLVGAEDVLRKLSLLKVKSVVDSRPDRETRLSGDEKASISITDDLRSALARLLEGSTNAVVVLDQDGRPVDRITFSDLQATLSKQAVEAQS